MNRDLGVWTSTSAFWPRPPRHSTCRWCCPPKLGANVGVSEAEKQAVKAREHA
jgi:hypothetical protein